MSALERLGHFNIKIVWVVVLLSVLIPTLYPLGLPVTVSPMTKDFYSWMNNLPPDQVCVFIDGLSVAMYYPMKGGYHLFLKLLMEHDAKFIIHTTSADGPIKYSEVLATIDPEQYGYVYGEDYVLFGYLPGGEMAIASFATDTWGAYSEDYYGNPTSSLPLMQRVRSWEDVDIAMLSASTCVAGDFFVRQWSVGKQNDIDDPYGDGVTTVSLTTSPCAPVIAPYWRAKPGIHEMLYGVQGQAELEKLDSRLGVATGIADSKNLCVMVFVILIVAGNIGWVAETTRKRREMEE